MAELYLVEFKGSRKAFFFNSYYHNLSVNGHVIVQAERGEDIGVLLKKIDADVDFSDRQRPRSILRPASADDRSELENLRATEERYRLEVIEAITRHRLNMRVVDVECQFDGNKMTVYFTADRRVDFRELVKDLAARYRTRIELRQIGVRDEARRIGGFGICGRRQCCNTFVREFAPISTQHAREQNLPLNPAKISGNCGRLLCCLRYEADLYAETKRSFPDVGTHVITKVGSGTIERIDVFTREAVVRGSDGVPFRCSPSDIQQPGETARDEAPPAPEDAPTEEESNGLMDDEDSPPEPTTTPNSD